MSKVLLCSVSDDRFFRKNGLYGVTQKKIESIFRNNPSFGIDRFLMNTWEDIEKSQFYEENKVLLSNTDASRNGRAYKAWTVSEALKLVDEGDYVIYTDCSPEMWTMDENYQIRGYDLNIIKKLCSDNGGILTAFVKWDSRHIKPGLLGIHTHENFTLDRCMKKMGYMKYAKSFMPASGMIVIQKSSLTVEIVAKWLYYNTIDQCCALGKADVPGDYSFWDAEDGKKLGARADQSILGLLLCAYGYKSVDIVHTSLNPYNFLNFCRPNTEYEFIDLNHNPEPPGRIRKGDKVFNKAGEQITVFEIWPIDGKEVYIVGPHRQSAYQTTEDLLTPIKE